MRAPAHTPGPWHAGEGNGEGSIFKTSEGRMRMEQGGTTLYPICTMVRGWKADEDAANARLIAAAPDMLETLLVLTDRDVSSDVFLAAMERARAIIAKAAGGA